jgi:ankyrin repeat protein
VIHQNYDCHAHTHLSDYNTVLHWAAEDREKEVVELLLKTRCNPLFRNNSGKTPLETAIYYGNYEAVLVLSGYQDSNSLAYAVECEQSEIVQLLLIQGANVNAVGSNGKSAWKLAKELETQDIHTLLLKFVKTTDRACSKKPKINRLKNQTTIIHTLLTVCKS